MNKTASLALIFLASILLLGTCASERAISGGPEDKTVPEVISSFPETGSTGIDPGVNITIRFSEQMQKSTVESALQIWPRPSGGIEVNTSWTSMRVSFNDPLAANETYLLTLDKTAKDLRGNSLAATYTLAFSTGDSLNGGKINGSITGNSEVKKNGNILLFRELGSSLDQLSHSKADYIFQPNDAGEFALNYLSNQQFLLFYHWDRNRNKVIDEGDYFGRPERNTVFARTDSLITAKAIWPQVIPPKQVKLLEVSLLTDRIYQVRTNLQYADITLDSLGIHSDNDQIQVLDATRVQGDDVAMHLLLSDTLRAASEVWITGFVDTSEFKLSSDTIQVRIDTAKDSLHFFPLRVTWDTGSSSKYPSDLADIAITGNLPFAAVSDSAFQLHTADNDSTPIGGLLSQISAMQWKFLPEDSILGESVYRWKIHSAYLDVPRKQNGLDSLWQGRLSIIDEDSLGSIRLVHGGADKLSYILSSSSIEKEFELEPGAELLIEELPATSYTLTAFVDKNGDGRYNSGGMQPHGGAEPFWIYQEPITVRARWETDIGEWTIK